MASTRSTSGRVPQTSSRSSSFSSSSSLAVSKAWVDPATLHLTHILLDRRNAPDYVKSLLYNTFMAYGVGDCSDAFGYTVGKAVRFVEVDVNRKMERNERLEASTIAEICVTKNMLNGAGALHGGCIAYLIDNCCSTPLVALGLIQSINGVGVTQSMNVLFHAPAEKGSTLRIISTSIALGGRVMSSRCEIVDRNTGRTVASAFMSKMQPQSSSKL